MCGVLAFCVWYRVPSHCLRYGALNSDRIIAQRPGHYGLVIGLATPYAHYTCATCVCVCVCACVRVMGELTWYHIIPMSHTRSRWAGETNTAWSHILVQCVQYNASRDCGWVLDKQIMVTFWLSHWCVARHTNTGERGSVGYLGWSSKHTVRSPYIYVHG